MNTVKTDVKTILKNLPEDCSYEDVQYQLYVIEKVKHSQNTANKKGSLSESDVENGLRKWL